MSASRFAVLLLTVLALSGSIAAQPEAEQLSTIGGDIRALKIQGNIAYMAEGSKFVVLKLVDLIFGDAVSLGGFIPVTLLIVALLISRAAVRRLLDGPLPAG